MAKVARGAEDPTPAEMAAADKKAELAAEEDEVATAEEAEEATEEEDEEANYVVVEYVGEPPYYREFITSHTIQKSSADPKHKTERLSFAGQGVEVPEDLVWSKENGWKVKVDPSLTDLLDGLRAQPFLKVRD